MIDAFERFAKAIAQRSSDCAWVPDSVPADRWWADLDAEERILLRSEAREVLLTIQEPTAAMLEASGMLDAESQELARSIWRDMIGALVQD